LLILRLFRSVQDIIEPLPLKVQLKQRRVPVKQRKLRASANRTLTGFKFSPFLESFLIDEIKVLSLGHHVDCPSFEMQFLVMIPFRGMYLGPYLLVPRSNEIISICRS
jgi:hypothetical protein